MTGKGPKNVTVNIDDNKIVILIEGILTRFEKESLAVFPDLEESFIKPRKYLFDKQMILHKEEMEDILEGKIIKADIQHNLMEDKAVITYIVDKINK